MSKMKRVAEEFNYWLDDQEGDTIIMGMTFSASDILQALDPIAYDDLLKDYINNLMEVVV
jgi:hypothetical protein